MYLWGLFVLLLLVTCGVSVVNILGVREEVKDIRDTEENSSSSSIDVIENQNVFILTLPRSGSTFVGELFRQNPEFAYLFEPLRAFSEQFTWDSCKATPHNPDLEGIMKAIYNCDFSVLQKSLPPDWGQLYSWERIVKFSGRSESCLPTNATQKRKMSVAVKEIEIWSPKLEWLHSILNSELYVLWLVRDVRGWVSSWVFEEQKNSGINFYNDWGFSQFDFWGYYKNCDIIASNKIMDKQLLDRIRGILTNSSSAPHLRMAAWWTLDTAVSHHYISEFTGKIKLVTYESISSHPFEMAQQIYSFLERPHVPPEVLEYLKKSTQGGNVAERYNTIRNSSAMTDIWRTRLTVEQIREIEDIAGVWFPYFGYEKIY